MSDPAFSDPANAVNALLVRRLMQLGLMGAGVGAAARGIQGLHGLLSRETTPAAPSLTTPARVRVPMPVFKEMPPKRRKLAASGGVSELHPRAQRLIDKGHATIEDFTNPETGALYPSAVQSNYAARIATGTDPKTLNPYGKAKAQGPAAAKKYIEDSRAAGQAADAQIKADEQAKLQRRREMTTTPGMYGQNSTRSLTQQPGRIAQQQTQEANQVAQAKQDLQRNAGPSNAGSTVRGPATQQWERDIVAAPRSPEEAYQRDMARPIPPGTKGIDLAGLPGQAPGPMPAPQLPAERPLHSLFAGLPPGMRPQLPAAPPAGRSPAPAGPTVAGPVARPSAPVAGTPVAPSTATTAAQGMPTPMAPRNPASSLSLPMPDSQTQLAANVPTGWNNMEFRPPNPLTPTELLQGKSSPAPFAQQPYRAAAPTPAGLLQGKSQPSPFSRVPGPPLGAKPQLTPLGNSPTQAVLHGPVINGKPQFNLTTPRPLPSPAGTARPQPLAAPRMAGPKLPSGNPLGAKSPGIPGPKGIPGLPKLANAVPPAQPGILQTFANKATDVLGGIARPGKPVNPYLWGKGTSILDKPGLAAAAVPIGVGGVYGGYRLADYLLNKSHEAEQDSELEAAKAHYEQMLLDAISKQGSAEPLDELANTYVEKSANILHQGGSLAAILASMTALGAGTMSYNWAKSRHNNRALRDAIQERRRQLAAMAVQPIYATPEPYVVKVPAGQMPKAANSSTVAQNFLQSLQQRRQASLDAAMASLSGEKAEAQQPAPAPQPKPLVLEAGLTHGTAAAA